MALADGKLSPSEKDLLQSFGESQGMSWADVKLLMAGEKAALFAEAREGIRTLRQSDGGQT